MMVVDHVQPVPPPLTVAIRPMAIVDHGYVRATWREAMKDAPSFDRMPWAVYKQTAGKVIADLINDDATRLIGAYAPDGRVAGWICYSPGRSISTVHWTHTRHELDGEKCRRRGVMTLLLEAAQVGRRFVYTHRGPRRRAHRGGGNESTRGPSIDATLVEWLAGRGVIATHVPIKEWLR